MNIYKKAEDDKRVLKVVYDDLAENPRDWCNVTKMICWHNRYDLGDSHSYESTEDMLRDEVSSAYSVEELYEVAINDLSYDITTDSHYATTYFETIIEGSKARVKGFIYAEPIDYIKNDQLWDLFSKKYVILPLYLYDHSGITISTAPFTCRWDSGQVGWVYSPKELLKEECPNIEPLEALKGEVEIYNDYIVGDVFGFVAEEKSTCHCCNHEKLILIDQCYGYYGELTDDDLMGVLPVEFTDLIPRLHYA